MFESIDRILKRLFKDQVLKEKLEEATICRFFNNYIKSRQVKAVYFKEGFLNVKSFSPALASDIKLKENEIIKSLNEKIGKNRVQKIIFR